MIRSITMDDRARMPWRFYGAARAVLARAAIFLRTAMRVRLKVALA